MCNCLTSSFFLHLHPLSMSSPAAFVKSMRFLGWDYSCAKVNSMPYSLSCHVQAIQVPPGSEFFANAECQGGFFAFMSWRLSFPLVWLVIPFYRLKRISFPDFLTSLGIFFKQIYNNIKHSYTRHITRHQSSKAHDSIQIILTLRQLSSYLRKLRFNLCHVTFVTKVHWKGENQLCPTS